MIGAFPPACFAPLAMPSRWRRPNRPREPTVPPPVLESLTQETWLPGGPFSRGRHFSHKRGAGHGPLAERSGAAGAKVFIKFARRKDQQEFFANRLGSFAFRAIKFSGGKGAKLFGHIKLNPRDMIENVPQDG